MHGADRGQKAKAKESLPHNRNMIAPRDFTVKARAIFVALLQQVLYYCNSSICARACPVPHAAVARQIQRFLHQACTCGCERDSRQWRSGQGSAMGKARNETEGERFRTWTQDIYLRFETELEQSPLDEKSGKKRPRPSDAALREAEGKHPSAASGEANTATKPQYGGGRRRRKEQVTS